MTYWIAKTKDGKIVNEQTTKWEDIKDQITELKLIIGNQEISLPSNAPKYIQFKTASATIGKNNVEIESRVIGFSLGNNIVMIRINEKTNNISIEI